MIRFTVNLKPIGVNLAYAPAQWGNRHGFRMTPEAKAYKELIAASAHRAMNGRVTLSGPVAVGMTLIYPNRRSDIDGSIKLNLDALQGVVYANDRQIVRLVVEKLIDKKRPRIIFDVCEVYETVEGLSERTKASRAAALALRRESDVFERSARLVPNRHDHRPADPWEDGHESTRIPEGF